MKTSPLLNLTCFGFFGQVNVLFWTAQQELSDVEEEFWSRE